MNLPKIIESNEIALTATLEPYQFLQFANFSQSKKIAMIASQDKATSDKGIHVLSKAVTFKSSQGKISIATLNKVDRTRLKTAQAKNNVLPVPIVDFMLEKIVSYTLEAHTGKIASRPQIYGIIDVITSNYWLSIPELLLILKQGLASRYGKIYTLNGETVAEWINKYWSDERSAYYESKAIAEKLQHEKGSFAPEVAKAISSISSQNPELN